MNKEVLMDKGTIGHIQAEEKVLCEFKKYDKRVKDNKLSEVEKHFLESLNEVEKKVKNIKRKY